MGKIIDDEFLELHVKRAEEIMLNAVESKADYDYKFSSGFNKTMKKLIKYESRTPLMRKFMSGMRAAAAVFIVIITMTFLVIVSVKAYRIRAFKFITKVFKEYTEIKIGSDEITGDDTLVYAPPTYVPEGYSVIKQTGNEYKNSIIYADKDGWEINYSQDLLGHAGILLDTEDAKTEYIDINGNEALLISKKGLVQLFWHDRFNRYLLSGYISEDEIVKMAKSIEK